MPSLSPPPQPFSTISQVQSLTPQKPLQSSLPVLHPVLVIVLGDIGHSPRMAQHIQELLRNGYEVNCIAYKESSMPSGLASAHRFHFYQLPSYGSIQDRKGIFLVFFALYKVFAQMFALTWAMLFGIHSSPRYILVQNPSCIPLFLMLPFVSWIYGALWIIDWHNLSWSIMAMSHGSNSLLVRMCRWIEYTFGKRANAHICVTNAMKEDLISHDIPRDAIVVCYDHPAKHFKRSSIEEVHELFIRLMPKYKNELNKFLPESTPTWTPFTKSTPESSPSSSSDISHPRAGHSSTTVHSSKLKLRSDRPALIISSTSWTVDENFDLLLDAIDIIEAHIESRSSKSFPKVLIIITGKGPLKSQFLEKYSTKHWKKFAVVCDWFESKDYPKLLGSADLGISFHASSSGLDFPMKVVDMLGSDLPVLALDFPCISELVHHNVNGLVFKDSNELADQLIRLLDSFPENEELQEFHRHCEQESLWDDSWSEHWSKKIKPLFKSGLFQGVSDNKKQH